MTCRHAQPAGTGRGVDEVATRSRRGRDEVEVEVEVEGTRGACTGACVGHAWGTRHAARRSARSAAHLQLALVLRHLDDGQDEPLALAQPSVRGSAGTGRRELSAQLARGGDLIISRGDLAQRCRLIS